MVFAKDGSDADDRVGLAVEHRTQGRVRVGDVEQRHVAERLELEELLRTVGGFEDARGQPGARGHREQHEQITPRDVHTR